MSQKTKGVIFKIFAVLLIVLVAVAFFVLKERQRLAEIEAEKARNRELYQELLSEYEGMHSLPLVDVDKIIDKTYSLGSSDYADEAKKIREEAFEYLEFVHEIWCDFCDVSYHYLTGADTGSFMLESLTIATLGQKYNLQHERIEHYYNLYEEYISDKGEYSLAYFGYANNFPSDYENYDKNAIWRVEEKSIIFECAKDSIIRNLDSQSFVRFFRDGVFGVEDNQCRCVYENGEGKYIIFGDCYINDEQRYYIVTLDFDGEHYSNDSVFYYSILGNPIY